MRRFRAKNVVEVKRVFVVGVVSWPCQCVFVMEPTWKRDTIRNPTTLRGIARPPLCLYNIVSDQKMVSYLIWKEQENAHLQFGLFTAVLCCVSISLLSLHLDRK